MSTLVVVAVFIDEICKVESGEDMIHFSVVIADKICLPNHFQYQESWKVK